MDARADRTTIPLAIDLDGTLIATDLLWEGLFQLLRSKPFMVLLLPFWLVRGAGYVKCQIARHVSIDPAVLPYRQDVLAEIEQAKGEGRTVILATGTHVDWAKAIAGHLGVFDLVMGTEGSRNFTSRNKSAWLVERYGDGGFDYFGNSRADLAVFDASREAVVVSPDSHAARWGKANGARIIAGQKVGPRVLIKMLRVHQWAKNSLVAVPVVLSHEYMDLGMVWACVLAFFSFSFAASGVYIINDMFDLALDRAHPTKRERPFASGRLSIGYGLMVCACLWLASFAIMASLPIEFAAVLVFYLAMTTAYSFSLKRMLLIDVFVLAGLYTLRIIAGAAATGTTVSFWLLAFSIFFFLSLALVKRYVELSDKRHAIGERIAGRGYRLEDREIVSSSGVASGFAAALVLALYIKSIEIQELYQTPWLIWPLAPIVLYIVMRIWVLAHRNEMHDDPIVFIMHDWRSQIVAAFGGVLLITAAYAPAL